DELGQANAPPAELETRLRQQERADVGAILDQLKAQGRAGSPTFDDARDGFRVDLTDDALRDLSASSAVGAVEPALEPTPATPSKITSSPSGRSDASIGTQSISSVNFIQVYSSFMWGRVSSSGLSVTLTLED